MGVKALKAKALHFKSLFYVPFFSVKWNIDKKNVKYQECPWILNLPVPFVGINKMNQLV